MKNKMQLLTLLFILSGFYSIAQTYTLNWGSSFSPAWTAGSSASRTTTNIGGSGTTATISFTGTEGTALSAFAAFSSPQVSSAGSPFNSQLGSVSPNLAVGMDLASNTGYVEVRIAFSTVVNNVVFNIADIDKANATSTTYYDEVLVTGLNGTNAVTNPVLSKLNGTAVNGTTDTVIISGNVARANTVSGRGGNTASNTTDQNGTVVVDFGSVSLTTVTVRYRNTAGSQANPAQQAIAIGNIAFQRTLLLPTVLTAFTGYQNNNSIELSWNTAQEFNSDKFIVEKSTDGISWEVISIVSAAKESTTARSYTAKDPRVLATNYYRLKQVDRDGTVQYSKVITVNSVTGNEGVARVYPNPVVNTANLTIGSNVEAQAEIGIYNAAGTKVTAWTEILRKGTNVVSIVKAASLSKGLYTIVITTKDGALQKTARFVKQ